ncbi:MAG: 30S ribosomal protein S15 [Candidatus Omnitrophica bacterium CG1_02_49_10]|nr:MAG: 30S ribosomal protein S15 [Candidatus Omnitrophica bacterium CG1_02_49_10]
MALKKERKKEVIDKFRIHEKDSGSSDVQIAILTERINGLTGHFKDHKKDHHSRKGLLKLVNNRRKLLNYLKKSDPKRYKGLISALGLRK